MLLKRALRSVLLSVLLLGFPATANAAPDRPVTGDVDLKLERDGALSVTEHVTVPPGGEVHRSVRLARRSGSGGRRLFSVENARVDGAGSARVTDRRFEVTLRPGESTVSYRVRGTVSEVSGHPRMRWPVWSGWDVPTEEVRIDFLAPEIPNSIRCLAGPTGSDSRCDNFQIGHTQVATARHFDLPPGQRVELIIEMPPGSVPADARFEEDFRFTDAFALTPSSGGGLAGIGFLVIGGFGVLWYTRGRDARVAAGEVGPVEVLLTDREDNVRFASPDGVLPGQVGTVIDEHVDVVDVTATIVDLAVRNYLWIEELPDQHQGRDWRIVGVNPVDESLRPYERAVYEMLLGSENAERAGAQVLVSELRSSGDVDLTVLRDRLYSDVVQQRWFARRPDSERNLFWWVGIGLAGAGAVLTLGLALAASHALLGLGVLVGGIAFAFGSRAMPARTRRGSELVAMIRGLRDYLRTTSAESLPAADREMVFSRSLPYAVVLGQTERWLSEFAELDPGADGTPGLYWYGELVERTGHVVPNLRRFRSHFPILVSVLDDVLSRPGQVRSLR